jgi:hypothetical protein
VQVQWNFSFCHSPGAAEALSIEARTPVWFRPEVSLRRDGERTGLAGCRFVPRDSIDSIEAWVPGSVGCESRVLGTIHLRRERFEPESNF